MRWEPSKSLQEQVRAFESPEFSKNYVAFWPRVLELEVSQVY